MRSKVQINRVPLREVGAFSTKLQAHALYEPPACVVHPHAHMPQHVLLSEQADSITQRRDTLLASACTVVGLLAIIAGHGGIENMIAGSVGSVGGGCIAVGLTFLDGRLSYAQRLQASLPIVLMLGVAGIAIRGNALALAGYPLLLLGAAGLIPAAIRWLKSRPSAAPESARSNPEHSVASAAMSN